MNAEKIFGKNVYVNLDEVIETVYQCRRAEANDEWLKRWLKPLKSLPTIEVSEKVEKAPSVVPSRVEGEWIPLIMNGEFKCSICGRASKSDNAAWVNIPSAYWNYCPNCGAKMRGADND